MSPSYDNSFGSFGTGGVNPGGGVGGARPINPGGNMMNSGPISSGTGDIMLTSTPERKSKKGLVIGVIVVVVLILAVVGAVIAFSGSGNKANVTNQLSDLQESYNSYVNYVIFGRDSNEIVDVSEILQNDPYFMSLDYGKRGDYIKEAGEKLKTLAEYYDQYNETMAKQADNGGTKNDEEGDETEAVEEDIEEEADGTDIEAVEESEAENYVETIKNGGIRVLRSFFEDYAGIEPLTDERMIEIYSSVGREAAVAAVDRRYSVSGAEPYINTYVDALKKYAYSYMDVLSRAEAAGCGLDGAALENCAAITENEKANIATEVYEIMRAERDLYSQAMNTLIELYDWFYESETAVLESSMGLIGDARKC